MSAHVIYINLSGPLGGLDEFTKRAVLYHLTRTASDVGFKRESQRQIQFEDGDTDGFALRVSIPRRFAEARATGDVIALYDRLAKVVQNHTGTEPCPVNDTNQPFLVH